jgi:hypothetical protein
VELVITIDLESKAFKRGDRDRELELMFDRIREHLREGKKQSGVLLDSNQDDCGDWQIQEPASV